MCPFCGGGAKPTRNFVECENCAARTYGYSAVSLAIARWNTRVQGCTRGQSQSEGATQFCAEVESIRRRADKLRGICQLALDDLVKSCESMGLDADDDPLVEKLRAALGAGGGDAAA